MYGPGLLHAFTLLLLEDRIVQLSKKSSMLLTAPCHGGVDDGFGVIHRHRREGSME